MQSCFRNSLTLRKFYRHSALRLWECDKEVRGKASTGNGQSAEFCSWGPDFCAWLEMGFSITNYSKNNCGNILTRCPGIFTITLTVKNELHLETEYLVSSFFYKACVWNWKERKKINTNFECYLGSWGV